jgi:hypothetical protein
VELSQPLYPELNSGQPADTKAAVTHTENKQKSGKKPDAPAPDQETEWRLRAYLQQTIDSAKEKSSNTFQARVAEPVFNANHTLLVPEGSVLVGQITQAKPARSFWRQGKLRFRFRELIFPSGFSQLLEGTLAGADSNKAANLQIDPEGGIQPKAQNRGSYRWS